MGAEKVSMNIVVVGQVQSAKAVKTVAKAAPATSQLMGFEREWQYFVKTIFSKRRDEYYKTHKHNFHYLGREKTT
ncbi:Uncharacterized protein FWK35_00027692, partial [Aphis craccivora]